MSGNEKNRIFMRTICFNQKLFWPKQPKRGNTTKIVVSVKLPKTKMTPSFEKGSVGWVKKWVLLTVFLDNCGLLKTLFLLCFQQCTAIAAKRCMLKNKKCMQHRGLFVNMAKRCFCSGVLLHV